LEWNKVAEGGDSESLFALLNASLKTWTMLGLLFRITEAVVLCFLSRGSSWEWMNCDAELKFGSWFSCHHTVLMVVVLGEGFGSCWLLILLVKLFYFAFFLRLSSGYSLGTAVKFVHTHARPLNTRILLTPHIYK
jgi:hypothetical protein